LQIYKICQSHSRDTQANALGTDVIGEDLRIEDHTADVDTKRVDQQEDIESGHSNSQSSPVTSRVRSSGEGCNHGGFDDKTQTASEDTDQHEWATTHLIHQKGSNSVSNDSDGDPATLQTELVFCAVAESGVLQRAVVVDNEDSSALADEGEADGHGCAFSVRWTTNHFDPGWVKSSILFDESS
jgi:hypothetical protein